MGVVKFLWCAYLYVFLPLVVPRVRGQWPWIDENTPRPEDGSLRCYQCDTTDETKPERARLCSFSTWKYANFSEKRAMIMQCPRKKSSFCHTITQEVPPDPDYKYTRRGCYGPRFTDEGARANQRASVGCFSMGGKTTKRVCLCNTILCNSAPSLHHAVGAWGILILLQTLLLVRSLCF